ncbi:pantoate--beta-alanine ligase [uncultured Abyssibacter sp.]|uniref:pantoate--beta-alanine ligase n=1 Tax=uncultured Abyssibacter sp. TaxID=2320202 RepID=UPI0032B1C61D
MKLVHGIDELRSLRAEWQAAGERVALVPTMGNLHAGHLSLVEQVRPVADRTVVSIFVNPLQFAPGEDFERYPRTLTEDMAQLEPLAPDVVFAPSVEAMYPRGYPIATNVVVNGLVERFCGEFRAGHFVGAATVVTILLNLVRPDVAIFGEKDYQQLLVFRTMARELHMPVEILSGPTVREDNGLAMSSRNRYLSAEERDRAAMLRRELLAAARALKRGVRDFRALETAARAHLVTAGFEPQYFDIVAPDLGPALPEDDDFVILAAAVLGAARLIDNIRLDDPALDA